MIPFRKIQPISGEKNEGKGKNIDQPWEVHGMRSLRERMPVRCD